MEITTTYDFHRKEAKNIVPSMSYKGGDIEKWQKDARKKLTALLGFDKYKECDKNFKIEYEKHENGTTEFRFTFESEKGCIVPGHILIPDGIKKPPVVICLQGHTPGMHISLGRAKNHLEEELIASTDQDFAARAIKEGFAAVVIDQRNFGELSFDYGYGQSPCLYSALSALTLGRTTVGERVWDAMRLIDVLEENFADKVDLEKLVCLGNSGGGTATAYLAALEERVCLCVPSCAMCAYSASINSVPHCACNYIPHIASYFDMNDLMAMTFPRNFIQVSGEFDKDFTIDGAKQVFNQGKKVYENNGLSDKCILVIGNGGHRFYADDTWPHIHKLIGR